MADKILKSPKIIGLSGTIQNDMINVRLEVDMSDLPYTGEPIINVIKIKKVQGLNGGKADKEYVILSEDPLLIHKFDMKNYESGSYEIKAFSYQIFGEKRIESEEESASFILMVNSSSIIHPLNTIEFERHIKTFNGLTDNMNDYIDGFIFDRPNNMLVKGLFIQHEILDSHEGIYHDSEVYLERNGEIQKEVYKLVFETGQDDRSDASKEFLKETDAEVYQRSGNKMGIVFIPCEIRPYDHIRIKLKLIEYTDVKLTKKLDETEKYYELSEFFDFSYVNLGEEKPQILFTELSKKRSSCQDVKIIYNNVNFAYYDAAMSLVAEGEPEGPDNFVLADGRVMTYLIRDYGTFKVSAYVKDRRYGEFDVNNPEEGLVLKAEKIYKFYPPCDIKLEHEKLVRQGKTLEIKIEANLPEKVKRAEIYVKNYTDFEILSIEDKGKNGLLYSCAANYSLDTKALPGGLHVLETVFKLTDGTEEVKTSTFLVQEKGKKYEVKYFD